jgi:hypothetical protein
MSNNKPTTTEKDRERARKLLRDLLLEDTRGGRDTAIVLAFAAAARAEGRREGAREMRAAVARKFCKYVGGRCNSGRCPCHAIRDMPLPGEGADRG